MEAESLLAIASFGMGLFCGLAFCWIGKCPKHSKCENCNPGDGTSCADCMEDEDD